MNIYTRFKIYSEKQQKGFAVLIDPDDISVSDCAALVKKALPYQPICFFVGGSLITKNTLDEIVRTINTHTDLPVLLFPGNSGHISTEADGILFLSLISGRNPEYLIGQHWRSDYMLSD